MRLFDFTEEDLTANRAGRLSARQLQRQRRRQRTIGLLFGLAVVAMVPILTLAIELVILDVGSHPLLSIVLPGAVLLTLVLLITQAYRWRAEHMLAAGWVLQAEGLCHLLPESGIRGLVYNRFQVGSEAFSIPAGLGEVFALLDNQVCRVYYVPNSREIVSVQALE
jgi:hypothetical protein